MLFMSCSRNFYSQIRQTMEPKELLTKRRIEKLASGYDFGRIKSHTPNPEGKYDVFISHSSRDIEFIRKVLLFLKNSKSV